MSEEIKFTVGDIVRLHGFGGTLFEIIGYVQEKMFMYGEESEEIYFSMRSLALGALIQKTADQMIFIRSALNPEKTLALSQSIVTKVVDNILDSYNDLMDAYKHTDDSYYFDRANEVLTELRDYFRYKKGELK